MNKTERKQRIKDIIDLIDERIVNIKEDKNMIDKAFEKVEDLNWYLEENCLTPDDFDAEDLKMSILNDYVEGTADLDAITSEIDYLKEEVQETFEEMKEGSFRREEWEEFYYNLEDYDNALDMYDNDIDTTDELLDKLDDLKTSLENLI